MIRSKFSGAFTAAFLSAFAVNSNAAVVTGGAMQDWGGSFQASYTVIIEESDTLNGVLSEWLIDVQQPAPVQITSAWPDGYNGGISTFSSDTTFTISNADQGDKPQLIAGSQFNITVQGNKPADLAFDANTLSVEFLSLDEPPVAVAEVTTLADATSVQDWYNPQWGGGFNAIFECDLAATTASNVEIQLNYIGSGVLHRISVQGYLGSTTEVDSDGNSTTISSSDVPIQTSTAKFQVSVNGAGFSTNDFDVQCTSGDGIRDSVDTGPLCEIQEIHDNITGLEEISAESETLADLLQEVYSGTSSTFISNLEGGLHSCSAKHASTSVNGTSACSLVQKTFISRHDSEYTSLSGETEIYLFVNRSWSQNNPELTTTNCPTSELIVKRLPNRTIDEFVACGATLGCGDAF